MSPGYRGADTPEGSAPELLPGDPVAAELTQAIHTGDLHALGRMITARPELAGARMRARRGWRTPLHAATDWPGYYPAAPQAVAILLAAGADPNVTTGAERPETPLHWTASSDDVDVAVALIDGGAELETPGGSIGTPLDNAIGYGCWHVARLLVARGAAVDALWHAAALGLLSRTGELLTELRPDVRAISQAFWHACAAGQRRTAEYLLAQGAELNWIPDYDAATPLDASRTRGTQQANLIDWLVQHGAASAPAGG
jgi:hypothetical protein